MAKMHLALFHNLSHHLGGKLYTQRMDILKSGFIPRPHTLFAILGFFFGLGWLILTPPFQVPDEVNHFYRAYQIADGGFKAEQYTQRLGGCIPRSLIKLTSPFLDLRWQMNRKTTFGTIKEQWFIPLDSKEKVFIDFPNTALYNPVSYVPQIIPIFVLKKFDAPPLLIFYSARLFTLFMWILLIYHLIKSLVAFKWLFTFLLLLPMTVYMSMGISADVMTNLIAFLFLGFIVNERIKEGPFNRKEILKTGLFVILLASAKVVYMPLIFLFCLIPKRRFDRPAFYWFSFAGFLFIGLATAFLWTMYIHNSYIPYDQYNLAFRNFLDLPRCANMHEQLEYILDHGLYGVKVLFNTINRTFSMYYSGYIGTFGWLDAKMPEWLIQLSYLVLFVVAVFSQDSLVKFRIRERIILLGTLITITGTLLLSQLLSWECVGSDFIKTVQGRYFIPIFPLLFLSISSLVVHRWKPLFNGNVVVTFYSIFLLIISSVVIYKRYYISSEYDMIEIKCDTEKIQDNKLVTTLTGIFFENADCRSDEASRSGDYSLKLSAQHPYGYTYRLPGGQYGDIIEVEVWRLGSSGSITIAGDGGKAFYVGTNESRFTRQGEWNKLTLRHTLEANLKEKEIAVYIFNKLGESYFDDIKIRILKRKSTFGI